MATHLGASPLTGATGSSQPSAAASAPMRNVQAGSVIHADAATIYAQPYTVAPLGGRVGPVMAATPAFLSAASQPKPVLGLQAPKGLPMPPPLAMPNLDFSGPVVPMDVQNDLAVKGKQVEALSHYAASLQRVLESEKQHMKVTSDGGSGSEPLLVQAQEEVSAVAMGLKTLVADMAKAEEIANQLNTWFVSNASKMNAQESWQSPASWLLGATGTVKSQMGNLAARWQQFQSLISGDALATTQSSHGIPAVSRDVHCSTRQQSAPTATPAWASTYPAVALSNARVSQYQGPDAAAGNPSNVPVAVVGADGGGGGLPVASSGGASVAVSSGHVPVEATGSSRLCLAGHPLSTFTTPSDGYTCDVCGVMHASGSMMLGCRICNWDACTSCTVKVPAALPGSGADIGAEVSSFGELGIARPGDDASISADLGVSIPDGTAVPLAIASTPGLQGMRGDELSEDDASPISSPNAGAPSFQSFHIRN